MTEFWKGFWCALGCVLIVNFLTVYGFYVICQIEKARSPKP